MEPRSIFLDRSFWILPLLLALILGGLALIVSRTRLHRVYRQQFPESRRERLFLASVGFFTTVVFVRSVTFAIHHDIGPFHDVSFRGRHIHHLVWGIFLLLLVGYSWLLQVGGGTAGASHWMGRLTSMIYGVAAALTLDEFALWLNLRDVYWQREGRESFEAMAAFGSLLAMGIYGRAFFHAVAMGLLRPFSHGKRESKAGEGSASTKTGFVAIPKAHNVPPMLLLATDHPPEGTKWAYELKLDGYRAISFKTGGEVHLRSRNDKNFNHQYPAIVKALAAMPDETVIDGEVVALDDSGRPDFNALQNYGSAKTPLLYYVFDLMVVAGRGVRQESLSTRRQLLSERVLPRLGDPIRESPVFDASLPDLIASVRRQGLEGIVAKRLDSRYEPGQRSGAWQKMRVNQGQKFVIGGYTLAGRAFDAVIYGYYEGDRLMYAGRTRNGFTPSTRDQLHQRFRGLEMAECPFANLPEKRAGRWGEGLMAEKMKECRWLRPVLVGQFEFVEWTPDNHLRHSRFVALRDDKETGAVGRELK